MVSDILVNTDSGNSFMHDSTKPLPETRWAYRQSDQQGPVAFISVDYHKIFEDTD